MRGETSVSGDVENTDVGSSSVHNEEPLSISRNDIPAGARRTWGVREWRARHLRERSINRNAVSVNGTKITPGRGVE